MFISLYSFTTYGKTEFQSKIISSIVTSFVLKISFDLLNKGLIHLFGVLYSNNLYFLGLFVFSLISAYMLARITDSHRFKKFLSKLAITRTTNKNIWADAIKPGDYLELYLENPNRIYYGQALFVEEDASNPWIVLKNYNVTKPNAERTDRIKNNNHFAMLNTAKISRIKIVRPEPTKKEKRTAKILEFFKKRSKLTIEKVKSE